MRRPSSSSAACRLQNPASRHECKLGAQRMCLGLQPLTTCRLQKARPDFRTFYSAIDACAEAVGQWQQALKCHSDMQAANVSSDVVTFNLTIDACTKIDGQFELLDGMQATNVNPHVVIFISAIDACAKVGG